MGCGARVSAGWLATYLVAGVGLGSRTGSCLVGLACSLACSGCIGGSASSSYGLTVGAGLVGSSASSSCGLTVGACLVGRCASSSCGLAVGAGLVGGCAVCLVGSTNSDTGSWLVGASGSSCVGGSSVGVGSCYTCGRLVASAVLLS